MPADAGEKTEAPTPRRREDARKQGQVARSQDLAAAVLLLMGFVALFLLGPGLWRSLLEILKEGLAPDSPTSLNDIMPYAVAALWDVGKRLTVFILILLAAILGVLLAQVGWLLTFKPLVPSLSKISPLAGMKRLFSTRTLMMAVANFGKLIIVTFVVYLTVMGSAAAIIYAFTFEYRDVFNLGAALMFKLGMRASVALLILALLDFAWQKYSRERDLRMTKEEVKDELRSMEGDPKLKGRRRQIQLQLALQRLRKDVPTADVVVTNPTHVAVAIRYDETMAAPKLVAKGADHLALRIRQIAAEFGIPIVQRAPVARALYADVDIGEYIPERFYRAVAEILAYVYELAGGSRGAPRRELAAT